MERSETHRSPANERCMPGQRDSAMWDFICFSREIMTVRHLCEAVDWAHA